MSNRRARRQRQGNVKLSPVCQAAKPEGVPLGKTIRCKPSWRKVGYQVVYCDATGRQVAWAPDGPQRTPTLALRHVHFPSSPSDLVGYALVKIVTVERVVRHTLVARAAGTRRGEPDGSRGTAEDAGPVRPARRARSARS